MASRHTRLDTQFNAPAAVWPPGAKDDASTGFLVAEEKEVSFTTATRYITQCESRQLSQLRNAGLPAPFMPALHGFDNSGIFTLLGVIETEKTTVPDIRRQRCIEAKKYYVSTYISGIHIDGPNERCLTSARYAFTNLSEWLSAHAGIDESWEADHVSLRVPHEPKVLFDHPMSAGRLNVVLSAEAELVSASDGSRMIRVVLFVDVKNQAPESFAWYQLVGNRLENLFSLLTGSSVALERFYIYGESDDSGCVIDRNDRHKNDFKWRQCLRCTKTQLAACIDTWLSEPEEIWYAQNLALGVLRKGSLFQETEFLSLAQALEGIHRATSPAVSPDKQSLRKIKKAYETLLIQEGIEAGTAKRLCESMSHANDPSLRDRLTELSSRLSDFALAEMGVERKHFVDRIVRTRNFYTHLGTKIVKRNESITSGYGTLDPKSPDACHDTRRASSPYGDPRRPVARPSKVRSHTHPLVRLAI